MARNYVLIVTILLSVVACGHAQPASPLETTPRHGEWVEVEHDGRTVETWVVYPEVARKAMVVVLIHENRGLTDWVRSTADRLAAKGYIAIAPDLLSGSGPEGGRTSSFPTSDAAREAIYKLPGEQVNADLQAVVHYAREIPAANGKLAVAGFCWGGGRAWDAARMIDDLSAAFVFYGTGPADPAGVTPIDAPVFGFYGGNDERVNATIPKTEALMTAAGKHFDPVIYDGAGHAFMRLGEEKDASPSNRKAHDAAWERWLRLLESVD